MTWLARPLPRKPSGPGLEQGSAPFNREWVTQLEPISSLLPTVRWAPALPTSRSWEVPTTPAQAGRGHRRKEPQPQALVVT